MTSPLRKSDHLPHCIPLRALSQAGTNDGFVSREIFLPSSLTAACSRCVKGAFSCWEHCGGVSQESPDIFYNRRTSRTEMSKRPFHLGIWRGWLGRIRPKATSLTSRASMRGPAAGGSQAIMSRQPKPSASSLPTSCVDTASARKRRAF